MATEAADEETIVVDNASSDGSIEFIKNNYPAVKALGLEKNEGFALANNIGAREAKGRYIVFLNNDTEVSPGWLDALHKVLASEPEAGLAGSKLLLYDDPKRLNSAGAAIVSSGGGFDMGFMEEDTGTSGPPEERGAVCAASMMAKKDEFLSLGGFDPAYFMYFEDVDLSWRYWLSGKKVLYVPSSVVLHKFGGTAGRQRHSPIRVFYGTRNSLLNVIKNFEAKNMPLPLLFNIVRHSIRTLVFFLSLKPKQGFSVIRAYFSLLGLLPHALRMRSEIQSTRKVADKYMFERRLILPLSEAFREYLRLRRIKSPA